MEREAKHLANAKENEIQVKKLQIEMNQKDSIMGQEIERMTRLMKSKDLIVIKTKETFSKLVEQKDNEIKTISEKLNQASRALTSNQSQNQANMIRELERKVINHEKMIEIYKNKITQKPVVKADDDASKEEIRRLQMLNTTMKNQLDQSKKDIQKYQDRITSDTTAMNLLKAEKIKADSVLKKVLLENNYPLENIEEKNVPENYGCPFLKKEIWISATGKISPCCAPDKERDKLGDFGNIQDQTLQEIVSGNNYQNLVANYKNQNLCKTCNMRKP
jgi:radical SAM protein with 4Fe4S-binding SPASM domain